MSKTFSFSFQLKALSPGSLELAHRQRVKRNKFFPKQRTALDDLLSQERKEKEAANSTSPATTDEEPVVLRMKVTVPPVSYGTDFIICRRHIQREEV